MLASYAQKRENVGLADIGFEQQSALFDREAERLGHAPPVIDADDVLANPREALTALCKALDLPFTDQMLQWPAGRRDSDGVWGAVWYEAVERSTGFSAPRDGPLPNLGARLQAIADRARPHYERLAKHKLVIRPA